MIAKKAAVLSLDAKGDFTSMLILPREITGVPLGDEKTPVYLQNWLTKIAARSGKTRTLAVTEGDRLLGSLTIFLERNGVGMKQGYNLPWARLCGPNVFEDVGEEKRAQITRRLIRQLPKDVSFFLTLADEFDFRLFVSEGFQSTSEDNYVISPDRLPALQAAFSSMTKRHIKQAQRDLMVSSTTPAAFVEIYAADLAQRRRHSYAPLAIARDILTEGLFQGQARIFTAKRRDTGEIDAAIACLWDNSKYYYWMTTRRLPVEGQSKPHQGAVKLLLWSAIQDAAARGLTFDFDGAGTDAPRKEGTTRLYDGMGAQRCVRYAVKRETTLERLLGRFRPPVKLAIRKTVGRLMTLRMNH
jgi:Acetyltransferase (GNAT) domain